MEIKSKYIAHRGIFNNIDTPENTIKAFKKAINLNYPFELDVQMTNDEKIVVFHDDNLKRLTNNDKNIIDCDYDEIKSIKLLNTRNYIPLFSDVLKLNNDKVLIIVEIKATKNRKKVIDKVINLLDKYNNYIIQSDDPKIIRYIKKNYPNITSGFLVHYDYKSFIINKIFKSSFILKYTHCDFVSISKRLLKDIKYMKKVNGLFKFIWTIKDNNIDLDNDYCFICDNLPYINK